MVPCLRAVATLRTAFLLALSLLAGGCSRWSSRALPSVTFTKIPIADAGGPEKVDTVEGRASGVHPEQQIVLYAKSEGVWWIQPYTQQPFTQLHGSHWENQTHLGTEYAALLVDPGYSPPEITDNLPPRGNGVEAVAVVSGRGPVPAAPPVKTLQFSGYNWIVRATPSFRGGSLNFYESANAWTDESGALHLHIFKHGNHWTCAEVRLNRSLGYGTYVFVVRDTSQLEPSAVLTLFTWDDLGTEQNRHELDVEISRWGYEKNENAHYVVQPYYIPTNVVRFRAPAGVLTHSFHWEPAQTAFSTYAGSHITGGVRPLNQHVFTSGVPAAGGDSVRMNLYVFAKGEIPLQRENEVVIEKFAYYP